MPITFQNNRKIFDLAGRDYEIGSCLYTLPGSVRIFHIEGDNDIVFVETPDIVKNRSEIRKMSARSSDGNISDRMLWPDRPAQDYSGFICRNPHIQGKLQPLSEIIMERKAEKDISEDKEKYCLDLGLQLAEILQTLHENGYTAGRLRPGSFFADETGKLFSCLTYRFSFQQTVKLENLENLEAPCYVVPEWLKITPGAICYNNSTDSFLYALILFQLLTGRFPFASGSSPEIPDRETLWDLMCDGKSLYFWEDPEIISPLTAVLDRVAPGTDELFRRAFDYCGYDEYGEFRPSVREWAECLRKSSNE